MSPPPSQYAPEGGKLRLAEAIFNSYRFLVRCPNCPGNANKAGFIKDEGGKSSKDGLKRRQWACQMSNGRHTTQVCPRVTCTDYILLAQHTLSAASFKRVVRKVCNDSTLDKDERQAMRTYFREARPQLGWISSSSPAAPSSPPTGYSSTLTLSASADPSSDAPAAAYSSSSSLTLPPSSLTLPPSSPLARLTPIMAKRKAEGEPPDAPSKAVPPSLRLRAEVRLVKQRLRLALDLLSPLLELTERWDEVVPDTPYPAFPPSSPTSDPLRPTEPAPPLPSFGASTLANPADPDRLRSLVDDFERADGPGKSAIRRLAREEGIYDQFFIRIEMRRKSLASPTIKTEPVSKLELGRSDRL